MWLYSCIAESVYLYISKDEEVVPKGKESLLSLRGIVRNTIIVTVAALIVRFQWSLFYGSSTSTLAGKDAITDKVWLEIPCSKDYDNEIFSGKDYFLSQS